MWHSIFWRHQIHEVLFWIFFLFFQQINIIFARAMVSDNFITRKCVDKNQTGLAGVGLAISDIALSTPESRQKCKNQKTHVSVVFIVEKIDQVQKSM